MKGYYIHNVQSYINKYKVRDDHVEVIHLLAIPHNPIANLQLARNIPNLYYTREIKNFMLGLFFLFFIRKHWHK
jgi:hypothetical protein